MNLNLNFYVPVAWLQLIHYYYFSMGIFSFAAGVAFISFPNYATIFFISYVLNSIICWYVAWWLHKRVKRQIIINLKQYYLKHLIASVIAVAFLGIILYLNFLIYYYSPGFKSLTSIELNMIIPIIMDMIIGFNYFTLVAAFMWSFALKFDVVNKAFSTYNKFTLSRAKNFTIKLREKLKTEVLVPSEQYKTYKPGTNEQMDAIIMEIWKYRKSPTVGISVKKLEMMMCEQYIKELENRLNSFREAKNLTENELFQIKNYQNLINKYNKELVEYRNRTEREEVHYQ